MRKTMQFLIAFVRGALRGQPVEIPHVHHGSPAAMLTPDGRFMPGMAGGDETPEEKAAREEAERKAAEDEAEAAEAEAKRAEEERKAAEEAEAGRWEGEVDKEKAERAVRNARAAEKKAKEEAEQAKAEAAELRQAQETEHETAKRERDEARVEAEQAKARADRLTVDTALRDAAAEAGVAPAKIRRFVRMVERDGLEIDSDGEVTGAEEAVDALLEEFPEFKAEPSNEEGPPKKEKPGGNPDRKRKEPELTPEQLQKMAQDEPDKFNQLMDEGKIPASALGG